ncbi:MAG: alanine racemase [Anaerolineae bacterium]|nr:alanine racemase [Anaerolineae bacterium]
MSATPLTYAEVNLEHIAHNARVIKRHIGPSVALMAVVKANAYGHGAVEVARTALASGADWLVVARIEEGLELRAAGITAPVLVAGYTPPDAVEAGVEHDLALAVTEPPVAERISRAAQRQGKTARVHVKVDSGMGRYGLLPDEVVPLFDHLASLPGITIEGVFSHLAVAELPDKAYTWQQFHTFERVLEQLDTAGYRVPVRHIANSAGALDLPPMHLDAVRVGVALYGLRPSDEVEPSVPLKPALALKSHVVRVSTLPAGSSISYGRTYITPREMAVALVPVGYGDGYHRLISNRGAVLINGRRAPLIGRVCMDQFVVDVSAAGRVAVGDEVVLIGNQGEASIPAEEVARWADTINYEVTTALLPRVARVFVP